MVDDLTSQKFTDLLKKGPDTTVRVAALGRFFSGEKRTINGATSWGGAGHLDCCSLFVIERVESFEAHQRTDLDYTAEAGWNEKEGCKFRTLRDQSHVSVAYPDNTTGQAIAQQKRADNGDAAWAFRDQQRVAVESLKPLYPGQVPVLRSVRKTSARRVFQVVVVVTRSYWLSFYASSGSVVWVTSMIKEAGCDEVEVRDTPTCQPVAIGPCTLHATSQ